MLVGYTVETLAHLFIAVHNSQDMESTYEHINRWMDEKNMYTYTMECYSAIKKNNDVTGRKMDVKWNKLDSERQISHVFFSCRI
jgi:hypothetical protein